MYRSVLNFKETQIAIKQVKDYFQKELAEALNLMLRNGAIDGNQGFGPERLPERHGAPGAIRSA